MMFHKGSMKVEQVMNMYMKVWVISQSQCSVNVTSPVSDYMCSDNDVHLRYERAKGGNCTKEYSF